MTGAKSFKNSIAAADLVTSTALMLLLKMVSCMYNRFEWMKLVIMGVIAILKHPVNLTYRYAQVGKFIAVFWGGEYFLFFPDKKSRQKEWGSPDFQSLAPNRGVNC